DAALALVVGAHDEDHVLQRDHQDQRPEDQRQHAQHAGRRNTQTVFRAEDFAHRVQRAGADVAEHHADRADRERAQRGTFVPAESGDGHDRCGALWRDMDAPADLQISTWVPSSIRRLLGMRKNAVAGSALRAMNANNLSRHIAMPGRSVAMMVSRERKNVVSIMSKPNPFAAQLSSRSGTSGSSAKPKRRVTR